MTRVLTAIVLIGLLAGVLYLPPIAFTVALLVVFLAGWRELSRLAYACDIRFAAAPGALLGLMIVGSFALPPGAQIVALLLAVPLMACASIRDNRHDARSLAIASVAGLAGLAWLAFPLGAQIGIRHLSGGHLWLVFLFGTVAAGDSAAYYGGTRFGRRRLAPELSPKKSVEGAVFGLIGSALAGALISQWLPATTPFSAAALGAVLGLTGQCGDLIESAVKRTAGVKDSSDLLPGHGGVLDRIDAHLPAGAVLYAALMAGWIG